MPRFLTRPALALLGTLLCLAACTPTARPATVGRAPTATPARVPAGWKVLTAPHYSLAYPPDWLTFLSNKGHLAVPYTDYHLYPPNGPVRLEIIAGALSGESLWCSVVSPQEQPTTLAGLPMRYELAGGRPVARMWSFLNAQKMSYGLWAYDGDASAATKAQDDAILATFRPDDATPWKC